MDIMQLYACLVIRPIYTVEFRKFEGQGTRDFYLKSESSNYREVDIIQLLTSMR